LAVRRVQLLPAVARPELAAGRRPTDHNPNQKCTSAKKRYRWSKTSLSSGVTRWGYRIAADAGDLQQVLGLAETIEFD
jgi:hypothetical protein